MRQSLFIFAVWLATWSQGLPAGANERDLAKAHFEKGIELMQEQRFHEATWELSESMQLYPTKGVIYNLANCYRATGQYIEAIALFDKIRTALKANDFASTMYIKRCETMRESPPGPGWDGVYTMTTK